MTVFDLRVELMSMVPGKAGDLPVDLYNPSVMATERKLAPLPPPPKKRHVPPELRPRHEARRMGSRITSRLSFRAIGPHSPLCPRHMDLLSRKLSKTILNRMRTDLPSLELLVFLIGSKETLAVEVN